MDDILTRLKSGNATKECDEYDRIILVDVSIIKDAADEIERLRARLAEKQIAKSIESRVKADIAYPDELERRRSLNNGAA